MPKKIKVKYQEIKNSPLFVGIPDKVIKKIATYCTGQIVPQNTVIFKENDKFYILKTL